MSLGGCCHGCNDSPIEERQGEEGEDAHDDRVNDDVHLDQVLAENDKDDHVHRVVDWVFAHFCQLHLGNNIADQS